MGDEESYGQCFMAARAEGGGGDTPVQWWKGHQAETSRLNEKTDAVMEALRIRLGRRVVHHWLPMVIYCGILHAIVGF